MRGRLGGHGAFLAGALFLLLVSGLALALLTDTPAEIRLREQLGLDAPCLVETEDSPGWRAGPPLPYGPRDELRAASLDGDIYLTGGTSKLLEYGRPSDIKGVREYVRAQSVDDFIRFDPDTGEYTKLAPMPERLNHHVVAAYDGKIYVVGGFGDLLFGADPRDDMFVYDPETDEWSRLPSAPTPRGAAAGAVIGDSLYVAGGMTSNGRLTPALEAFDFETEEWRTLADIPTPREHMVAAEVGGDLYVAGGRTLTSDSIDVVERYEPDVDRWTRVRALPQRAGSFDAVSVDGYLVTVGGDNDAEGWVTGAVQRYDPRTNAWTQLPEMRTKRHGHAVAIAGDRLWAFGGSPCARFAARDIVESFDLRQVSR